MKGYGLGKNSPVKFNLGQDNYEGLIARHGQRVRWRQAVKCTCIQKNGRPDLKCTACGGEGWRYQFQKTLESTISAPAVENDLLELSSPLNGEIKTVTNYAGIEVEIIGRYGSFVRLAPGSVHRGDRAELAVVVDLVSEHSQLKLTYAGHGRFVAIGFKGDIIECESVLLATGESLPVLNVRRNSVLVDGDSIQFGSLAYGNPKVLIPPVFAIVGLQMKQPDARFLESVGGNASMTFPAAYKVGEGDVITALSAHRVGKVLLTHGDGMDVIPDYFIDSAEYIESASKRYSPGMDFDLWGDNLIRWRDGRAPAVGETIFVMYQSCPTYRVLQEFPNVRSSENLDLPRRVALSLLSTYSPRKGV